VPDASCAFASVRGKTKVKTVLSIGLAKSERYREGVKDTTPCILDIGHTSK